MEKKNTVLLTVIAVATLLVAVVGATFAYFSANITETDKTQTVLKSAQLGITFDGTQEIEANSIEPGWSAQKKFTVENTSDYDMTFDINLTKVVNNFTNTNDLTYTATARFLDTNHTSSTVQMVALDETQVSGTKSNFAATAALPVDGSVNTATTPVTFTEGTNVTKTARVFIPAHSKQEFTYTLAYEYKAPSTHEVEGVQVPYALGDPADPNNQNVDQGKYFRTTFSITANGIDSTQSNNTNAHDDSTTNGEYATDSQTPASNN